MPWCKLHTDILGDAKLLRAARKGAKHLALLPWLLAWAKAHDPEDSGRLLLGGVPVEAEDIAAQVPGARASDVAACLVGLENIGVLARDETDVLRFAAWPTRSGSGSMKPSDHPDAVRDRVHRHRDKQRTAAQRMEMLAVSASDETSDATPHAYSVTRECNAPKRVTDVSSVTQNKSKKESETESEKKIPPTPVVDAGASGGEDEDPVGFSDAWRVYPRRAGHNPRKQAVRAYRARLREGHAPATLLSGVERYAAFIGAVRKVGTPYVQQTATFFGTDAPFLDAWDLPDEPPARDPGAAEMSRIAQLAADQWAKLDDDARWIEERKRARGVVA